MRALCSVYFCYNNHHFDFESQNSSIGYSSIRYRVLGQNNVCIPFVFRVSLHFARKILSECVWVTAVAVCIAVVQEKIVLRSRVEHNKTCICFCTSICQSDLDLRL